MSEPMTPERRAKAAAFLADQERELAELKRLHGWIDPVELSPKSVEALLKRERDEYEPQGECWNTANDVLDVFRPHMVTGTPLTEPGPQGGPEALGVGKEPLTEAEELRAELRAANEQLAAVWSEVEPWRSADMASPSLQNLVYRLLSIRDRAAIAAESSSPSGEQA